VNYLLDTHIWLWSLLEPARLSRGVAAALSAQGARRWLSPLSVWEALLLIERGRLKVDRPGDEWIREALERAPVEEAAITREVAFASRALTTRHQDPVDRFVAATARVFDLTLVTSDRQLFRLPGVRVLRNRSPRLPPS
jgi:PIN domain nuclease of toxin-antitoxin system